MSFNDYHIAAEKDVSGKVNKRIWYYFIGVGFLLFLTIYALDIMYKFALDKEKDEKIGKIATIESVNEVSRVLQYLSGQKGLYENKKYVAIEMAMEQVLLNFRQGK